MNPGIQMAVENTMTWLQLIVLVASVVTLVITVGKSAAKPNHTQNERLDALEEWQEKVTKRLLEGNTHFDNIDEGERVTQKAMLALLRHAINGNDIDALKEAEKELNQYLLDK